MTNSGTLPTADRARTGLQGAAVRVAAALLALGLAALGIGPARADATPAALVLSAPVRPVLVERLASLPSPPWHAGHRGIDLDADVGDRVTSPAAGVVSFVGFVVDRPVVSVRLNHGLVTSVEPVDSALSVGDVLARGQSIGTVASSIGHCAPGTCVHWGLRLDGVYVDPLDYLEGFGPVRLLPGAGG